MRVAGLRGVGIVLLLVVGLSLSACGEGDLTTPEMQNLRVRLTDAPSDELSQVNVFFESLTVKPRGEPVEHDVPLVLEENPQDLLELQDRVVMLATANVEPGTYEFIFVHLDEQRSNVVDEDGEVRELRIPSEKIRILGPFDVPEDGDTEITLDFDADDSLRRLGNGGWLMTPVIAITSVDQDS